jgi:DNA-binding transcriptional LysR family regulator
VKLIDRSTRPFVLTEEGQLYYDGCRQLVQRFERLEEDVRTLHDVEAPGRVAVASIYSVGLSHMNQLVQQFLQRHPRANVRLQYEHPGRVCELVESEACDLGLVSFPKSTRNLAATLWREEPMVLVCSPQHRLSGREGVDWRQLDGERLVGFDPDLKIRRETDRVLAAHDVQAQVVMEFDNIETIKRAVEIGAGVSLLPAPTVVRELQLGTLATASLADASFTRPVGVIRRRGTALGRTASCFMELLLESAPADSEPREAADAELREDQESEPVGSRRAAAAGKALDAAK